MRLARERQVNVRVIPIGTAIGESVDLAHEIYNCVFRRVPREMRTKITADDVRVSDRGLSLTPLNVVERRLLPVDDLFD